MIYEINQVYYEKGRTAYRVCIKDADSNELRSERIFRTKEELIKIGNVILDDSILVRKLIVLGWDTLEIHGDKGSYGCRWQLKDYIPLPKFNENE